MRYGLTLVTPPATQAVTLEEAKLHLRVDGTEDNAMIQTQIMAATALVENFTRRQLLSATYELRLDGLPLIIRVPKPPLQSVTSIAYLDTAGVSQTLATTVYTADTASEPGRIALKFGQVWPPTYEELNAVTVTFVAGWQSVGDVPEALKAAIKLLVGDMYQNRETTIDKPINEFPTAKSLMWGYVVDWIGASEQQVQMSQSWKTEWLS